MRPIDTGAGLFDVVVIVEISTQEPTRPGAVGNITSFATCRRKSNGISNTQECKRQLLHFSQGHARCHESSLQRCIGRYSAAQQNGVHIRCPRQCIWNGSGKHAIQQAVIRANATRQLIRCRIGVLGLTVLPRGSGRPMSESDVVGIAEKAPFSGNRQQRPLCWTPFESATRDAVRLLLQTGIVIGFPTADQQYPELGIDAENECSLGKFCTRVAAAIKTIVLLVRVKRPTQPGKPCRAA